MQQVIKNKSISSRNLSREFYFETLMKAARLKGLLSLGDAARIQSECLLVLEKKVEGYNAGRSSSIRVERAQEILSSIFYTVGVYLKTCPTPDHAIEMLQQSQVAILYDKGRAKIDLLLDNCHKMHDAIMDNLFETPNETYNDTIVGGIEGFFEIYNPDYQAQEIHITADYPSCKPINDLAGVEFIQEYLYGIFMENSFLRCFDKKQIEQCLIRYDSCYQQLIFNLFEPVLTAAIGCALSPNSSIRSLTYGGGSAKELYRLLEYQQRIEIEAILRSAAQKVKDTFLLPRAQAKYMDGCMPELLARVCAALESKTLERLFLIT